MTVAFFINKDDVIVLVSLKIKATKFIEGYKSLDYPIGLRKLKQALLVYSRQRGDKVMSKKLLTSDSTPSYL